MGRPSTGRPAIDDLIDTAAAADSAAAATVALVYATVELTDQQRIANKLQVALIDQLTGIASYLPGPGAQIDPAIRIRDYLDDSEWEGLGL